MNRSRHPDFVSFALAALLALGCAGIARAAAEEVAPQAAEPDVEDTASTGAEAALAPDDEATDAATEEAEAPAPIEGPLRPKGEAPPRPSRSEAQFSLVPSIDGGLRWKHGDAAVTLSGAPSRSILAPPASVRLGATIAR